MEHSTPRSLDAHEVGAPLEALSIEVEVGAYAAMYLAGLLLQITVTAAAALSSCHNVAVPLAWMAYLTDGAQVVLERLGPTQVHPNALAATAGLAAVAVLVPHLLQLRTPVGTSLMEGDGLVIVSLQVEHLLARVE